jgi:hypothetical protein
MFNGREWRNFSAEFATLYFAFIPCAVFARGDDLSVTHEDTVFGPFEESMIGRHWNQPAYKELRPTLHWHYGSA